MIPWMGRRYSYEGGLEVRLSASVEFGIKSALPSFLVALCKAATVYDGHGLFYKPQQYMCLCPRSKLVHIQRLETSDNMEDADRMTKEVDAGGRMSPDLLVKMRTVPNARSDGDLSQSISFPMAW